MRTIAFTHHKGGVGKTTSVLNVGAVLAKKGYRTLLIDLDAQANLTNIFFGDSKPQRTIYSSLREGDLPIYKLRDNLFLAPSSLDMVGAEAILRNKGKETDILRRLLEPHGADFDFVLIDCPPSLGLVTIGALTTAEERFVVLTPDYIPFSGLRELEETIVSLNKYLTKPITIDGVIVNNFVARRTAHKTLLRVIGNQYGDKVFRSVIRANSKIAESPIDSTDVVSYAPSSSGAQDYTALTEEIISRRNK